MSGPIEVTGLTEVEFDRLVDYTGGALSGRDEAEVARLVRTEPRWASAQTAVLRADAAVRSDLGAAGGAVHMPADVVSRLDAALSSVAMSAGDSSAGGFATQHPGTRTDATDATVTSIDARRSKRRRLTLQIGTAVAAGVAVLVGVLAVNATAPGTPTTSSVPRFGQPDGAAGAAAAPSAPMVAGPPTISSGRDYEPGGLADLQQLKAAGDVAGEAPGRSRSYEASAPAPDLRLPAPAPLRRLTDRDALAACLAAIAQTHPGVAVLVDYARFQGAPAVLVLVAQGGRSTVVVVGEECGVVGADEKDSVVVGR